MLKLVREPCGAVRIQFAEGTHHGPKEKEKEHIRPAKNIKR